jgi:hypothetical protein
VGKLERGWVLGAREFWILDFGLTLLSGYRLMRRQGLGAGSWKKQNGVKGGQQAVGQKEGGNPKSKI